jgi:hypothetical protein
MVNMGNMSTNSNNYSNPIGDYFKMMVDQWYNFVINYNKSYMALTEATYDSV